MRIETHTEDRKTLAKAIAEWIHEPVCYNRAPTYSYSIGPVTVDRGGAILCDDAEAWTTLMPFFEGLGWRETAEQELQAHLGTATEPEHNEAQENTTEENGNHCTNIPLHNCTVANVENLIRTLHAHQKMINAMMQTEALFIDDEVVDLLNDADPQSIGQISELVRSESAIGMIRGVEITEDEHFLMMGPTNGPQSTQWWHCATLAIAVADHAFKAHHVNSKLIDPEENAMKYFCNSWLNQLGLGGSENKDLRKALLGHLHGFAAFRSADKMEAHKARFIARRRAARQNAEVENNEAD